MSSNENASFGGMIGKTIARSRPALVGLAFASNGCGARANRPRARARVQSRMGFHTLISWSGLDIGRDRGSPVSHYKAPFAFTGRLKRVTVVMHDDQRLDGEGVGNAEMARQ